MQTAEVVSSRTAGEHPTAYISWPASLTAAICLGNVSRLWPDGSISFNRLFAAHPDLPGINHVVFIPYFANSFNSLGEPTSPANMPRVISLGESSPP